MGVGMTFIKLYSSKSEWVKKTPPPHVTMSFQRPCGIGLNYVLRCKTYIEKYILHKISTFECIHVVVIFPLYNTTLLALVKD